MGIFLETTGPTLDDLARALAAGDRDDARFAAHSIVGAARTAGAHRLAGVAASVEADITAGELIAAHRRLAEVEAAFRDVDTVIRTAL